MRFSSRPLAALATASFSLAALPVASHAAPPHRTHRADPRLRATERPNALLGRRSADGTLPLVVELTRDVTAAEFALVERLGFEVARRRDGSPRGAARQLLGAATPSQAEALSELPFVERVSLDRPLLPAPPPLDATIQEVGAPDVWRERASMLPVRGAGVTVCDIDSGIDPFHPQFFRADAGYFPWNDVDGDGVLTPGVDTVTVDGTEAVLRVVNAEVVMLFTGDVLFQSDDPAFRPGWDYLFADLDGSGAREYGADAGFDDTVPGLGEPLFLADDVDGDEVLDLPEKLVRLGTPKIAVLYGEDDKEYRRGEDLSEFVATPEASHGAGASGIVAGGNPGLTQWAGIAPDADLAVASNRSGKGETWLADWCRDEDASVVLHEYAPWTGYPLDGSSPLESFIDQTFDDGIVHINPAGNLSGAKKMMKRQVAGGASVGLSVPGNLGARYLYGSLLWREPTHDLSVTVTFPSGASSALAQTEPGQTVGGFTLYSYREDSSRGTARIDFYLFSEAANPPPVPAGDYLFTIDDPQAASGPVEVLGSVADEVSGWGEGIHWKSSVTEDHLIGHPGTADRGLAVSAYVGNGWYFGEPGTLAYYSGRGHRFDGEPLLWISAPDDPVSATWAEDSFALHSTFGGTSGASPHVAGAAALLRQAHPDWSATQIRDALRDGALQDGDTGAVPNDLMGWGKLRIYESVMGSSPSAGVAPAWGTEPLEVVLGQTATLPLDVSDADDDTAALVVELDADYDGAFEAVLPKPELEVTGDALGSRWVKARATDPSGRSASALLEIRTVEVPTPPQGGAGGSPAAGGDGCGCAVPGRDVPRGGLAMAALACMALARRGVARRAVVRRRR